MRLAAGYVEIAEYRDCFDFWTDVVMQMGETTICLRRMDFDFLRFNFDTPSLMIGSEDLKF